MRWEAQLGKQHEAQLRGIFRRFRVTVSQPARQAVGGCQQPGCAAGFTVLSSLKRCIQLCNIMCESHAWNGRKHPRALNPLNGSY